VAPRRGHSGCCGVISSQMAGLMCGPTTRCSDILRCRKNSSPPATIHQKNSSSSRYDCSSRGNNNNNHNHDNDVCFFPLL